MTQSTALVAKPRKHRAAPGTTLIMLVFGVCALVHRAWGAHTILHPKRWSIFVGTDHSQESYDRLSGNNLLRALRPADYALLAPHLEQVTKASGDLLYNPGDNVETVYFPCGTSLFPIWLPTKTGVRSRRFWLDAKVRWAALSVLDICRPIAAS